MSCIKEMPKLFELDLSFNKFTQLKNTTFEKLKTLNTLKLNNNQFVKLRPQVFSTLPKLFDLFVDRLASYKNLDTLIPSLITLNLNCMKWNCTNLINITAILNKQKVMIGFNGSADRFKQDLTGYACQMNTSILNNASQKKMSMRDIARMG